MSKVLTLQLQNFRNIEQAHLQFGEGLNLIIGDNAAGKTAIIEALWVLAAGRSFRTAKPQQLIQHNQPAYTLFCATEKQDHLHKIGINRSLESLTMKIDGATVKTQAEMASLLPVQLLTPESHRLLEEGPKARRQFMDWGCFYQAPEFMNYWRHYQRTLKQRNHALKQKLPQAQVVLWDPHLVEMAAKIDHLRQHYIEALSPYVIEFCQALMPELDWEPECRYAAGWPKSAESYADLLSQNYRKDSLQGHTQYGCHRADVKFKFEGQDALASLSRGQQKLFVCALLLAQASLHEKHTQTPTIMLIDDLPAELDAHHRTTLLKLLDVLNIQHILTSTEANLIDVLNIKNAKMWLIEKGHLNEQPLK